MHDATTRVVRDPVRAPGPSYGGRVVPPGQTPIARLSLATVYNTLEALCRAGLTRRLPTGNGCCRYDADTTEHLHLCFRESDEIQDVPAELGDRMMTHLRRSVIGEIERELGVRIESLSIQLLASRTRQRAGAF